MNKNDLYRSMQDIDDGILEESEKKKNNKPWLKLAVIAACFALLTAAAIAFVLTTGAEKRENGLPTPPETTLASPFVTEKENDTVEDTTAEAIITEIYTEPEEVTTEAVVTDVQTEPEKVTTEATTTDIQTEPEEVTTEAIITDIQTEPEKVTTEAVTTDSQTEPEEVATETEDTEPLIINKERYDKNKTALASEVAIEWPREYQTPTEKYTIVSFNGAQYRTRANEIKKDLLDKKLGQGDSSGSDKKFDVWKIKNVDGSQLTAVDIEGTFVVFMNNDPAIPATFKEFYDGYGLSQTLKLDTYCEKEGYGIGDWFKTDAGQYVTDALADCGDAPLVSADGAHFADKYGITFTATSEALGVYKKTFIITEEGYLCTNIAEYGYTFEIGKEKANEIISYVKAHSEKTEMEPFYNSVAGIITEIGDGYILVDDSVLCEDEKDGIVYKIPTDSIIVRRWIEYYHLNVGDAVMIEYKGDISKDCTVNGIVSMAEAIITGEGAIVEE